MSDREAIPSEKNTLTLDKASAIVETYLLQVPRARPGEGELLCFAQWLTARYDIYLMDEVNRG